VTFIAKYRGICTSCLEYIEPGQEVQSSGEYGKQSYVHVVCPEVLPAHKMPICKTCWLEKPCECDDN
jgi:RNase P subunit RPR2